MQLRVAPLGFSSHASNRQLMRRVLQLPQLLAGVLFIRTACRVPPSTSSIPDNLAETDFTAWRNEGPAHRVDPWLIDTQEPSRFVEMCSVSEDQARLVTLIASSAWRSWGILLMRRNRSFQYDL